MKINEHYCFKLKNKHWRSYVRMMYTPVQMGDSYMKRMAYYEVDIRD